jgi:hypothetical protein
MAEAPTQTAHALRRPLVGRVFSCRRPCSACKEEPRGLGPALRRAGQARDGNGPGPPSRRTRTGRCPPSVGWGAGRPGAGTGTRPSWPRPAPGTRCSASRPPGLGYSGTFPVAGELRCLPGPSGATSTEVPSGEGVGIDDGYYVHAKAKRGGALHEVPHFTPAERAARGKAERAEVPRSAHAEREPPPPIGGIRSTCVRSRRRRACRSSSRSGTGACYCGTGENGERCPRLKTPPTNPHAGLSRGGSGIRDRAGGWLGGAGQSE